MPSSSSGPESETNLDQKQHRKWHTMSTTGRWVENRAYVSAHRRSHRTNADHGSDSLRASDRGRSHNQDRRAQAKNTGQCHDLARHKLHVEVQLHPPGLDVVIARGPLAGGAAGSKNGSGHGTLDTERIQTTAQSRRVSASQSTSIEPKKNAPCKLRECGEKQ